MSSWSTRLRDTLRRRDRKDVAIALPRPAAGGDLRLRLPRPAGGARRPRRAGGGDRGGDGVRRRPRPRRAAVRRLPVRPAAGQGPRGGGAGDAAGHRGAGAGRGVALARRRGAALRAVGRLPDGQPVHRRPDPRPAARGGPAAGRQEELRGAHRPVPGRGGGGLRGAVAGGEGAGALPRHPALQLPGQARAARPADQAGRSPRRRADRRRGRGDLAADRPRLPHRRGREDPRGADGHPGDRRRADPGRGQRHPPRRVPPGHPGGVEREAGGARHLGRAGPARVEPADRLLLAGRPGGGGEVPDRRAGRPGRQVPAGRRRQHPHPDRRLPSRRDLHPGPRQGAAGHRRRRPPGGATAAGRGA